MKNLDLCIEHIDKIEELLEQIDKEFKAIREFDDEIIDYSTDNYYGQTDFDFGTEFGKLEKLKTDFDLQFETTSVLIKDVKEEEELENERYNERMREVL